MQDWVTIRTFTLPHQAAMVQTLLESHDIPVMLQNENTAQAVVYISSAGGGVRLNVPEDRVPECRQILLEAGYLKPEDLQPSFSERMQQLLASIFIKRK